MQVNVRDGKPKVKLAKKELKTLQDAAHILHALGDYAQCTASDEAYAELLVVLAKYEDKEAAVEEIK